MKISATFTVAISIGSLLFPQPTQAASVTLTPVTGVGRLQGVNLTQAVGYSLGGDEPDGFYYEKGNKTEIKIRNGVNVLVFGIENNGRAVGQYYEYNPMDKGIVKQHGFLYFHGDVTNIDYPTGATATTCRGINNPQRIVGDYTGPDGRHHAFFFDKKDYVTLPLESLGATNSYATAINNPGDIVGYYTTGPQDEQHAHGFLYDKQGNLTTFEIPGATDTMPYGINNAGIIVGAYIGSDAFTHGFVKLVGVPDPLTVDAPDTPLGVGTSVQGISDNGQLTVLGTTAFVGNIVP